MTDDQVLFLPNQDRAFSQPDSPTQAGTLDLGAPSGLSAPHRAPTHPGPIARPPAVPDSRQGMKDRQRPSMTHQLPSPKGRTTRKDAEEG